MKTAYMHQLYIGTIADMKSLERRFSDMAEKGWMIDKIGRLSHRYRAVEPSKKRFFVDFLPQITDFDCPENEDAQDYRSICEQSVWGFVAANQQLHVFCADAENPEPMPIHTDHKIEAQIYLKACRKYELPFYACVLIISLSVFLLLSPFGRGAEILLSNRIFFYVIGCLFLTVGAIWTIGFTVCWYLQTRRSAKNDLPMPNINYRLAKLRNITFAVGTFSFLMCLIISYASDITGGMRIVFLLFILCGIGGVLWKRWQIDTVCRTRGENINMFIEVIAVYLVVVFVGTAFNFGGSRPTINSDSLGNRPALTLSDVGITSPPHNYPLTLTRGSIAVPVNYQYTETNQQGNAHTHILRAINAHFARWLYVHYSNSFIRSIDFITDSTGEVIYLSECEAAFWGADYGMAFFEDDGFIRLQLIKDKTILRLFFDGKYTNLESAAQAIHKLWGE